MSRTETSQATSVAEVAHELVDLCRENKIMEAVEKFYSPDIVSVESTSGPGMPAEMKGIDAIKGKSKWWLDNHEIHAAEANGPFVGDGDQFAVHFKYDVTFKPTGKRMLLNEMALYTVKGGKVVHEHFFYNANA